MIEKQQQQTSKYQMDILLGCLFTMRQEDQSFDKALLGQNN